jgi:hypothetical protein
VNCSAISSTNFVRTWPASGDIIIAISLQNIPLQPPAAPACWLMLRQGVLLNPVRNMTYGDDDFDMWLVFSDQQFWSYEQFMSSLSQWLIFSGILFEARTISMPKVAGIPEVVGNDHEAKPEGPSEQESQDPGKHHVIMDWDLYT